MIPVCCVCAQPGDLRPYGPGGAPICFDCGTSPERNDATRAVFERHVDAMAAQSSDGAVLIGDHAPMPLTPKASHDVQAAGRQCAANNGTFYIVGWRCVPNDPPVENKPRKVSTSAEIVAKIDQRLDAILTHPNGWGPPHAVECQVLILLDVRRFAATGIDDSDAAMERYTKHLHLSLPDSPGALPLYARLKCADMATEQFVAILRAFVAQECAK